MNNEFLQKKIDYAFEIIAKSGISIKQKQAVIDLFSDLVANIKILEKKVDNLRAVKIGCTNPESMTDEVCKRIAILNLLSNFDPLHNFDAEVYHFLTENITSLKKPLTMAGIVETAKIIKVFQRVYGRLPNDINELKTYVDELKD